MGGGGWLDQVGLKLTQSPTGVGVGVGTELGNMTSLLLTYITMIIENFQHFRNIN